MHRIPSQLSISGRLRARMTPAVSSTLSSSQFNSRTHRYLPSTSRINEDDDGDDASDPEDDKPLSQTRLASSSQTRSMLNRTYSDEDYLAGPSTSSRSTRTQKRPYYNEETDEENCVTNNQSRKRRLQTSSDSHRDVQTTNDTAIITTSQIESDNSEDEQPLSVSSRGRIRKITAKARGLFRE